MVCLPSTTQAATFSWAKNISVDLHCNDSTNALSLATYVNAYPLSVLSFSNTVWTFQLFFEMTATYSLNQTTGSPSSLKESCLWAVLCYKRLLTKACMGCKRFFLKERKNVMFLNKMYLPLLPCCILCCLPASQAVLKRFRRVSAILEFYCNTTLLLVNCKWK